MQIMVRGLSDRTEMAPRPKVKNPGGFNGVLVKIVVALVEAYQIGTFSAELVRRYHSSIILCIFLILVCLINAHFI